MNFINWADHLTIMFIFNSAGILIPMYKCPEGYKNKISYFIKLEPAEITINNYECLLIYGDVSPNPIGDLKAITEHVSSYQICFILGINLMEIYLIEFIFFNTIGIIESIFNKRKF